MGFISLPYTWQRGNVKERLDRVLFNQCWLNTYPSLSVKHGVRRSSDHKPLLIDASSFSSCGFKPFRFQNMWIAHHAFLSEVKKNWAVPARGVDMKIFWEKLHRLKQFLRWWNKSFFGNIFDNLKQKEEELAILEERLHLDPSDSNTSLFNNTSADLQKSLGMEENF